MENRERRSETTSSVRVGRCAMSTSGFPLSGRPPYDASAVCYVPAGLGPPAWAVRAGVPAAQRATGGVVACAATGAPDPGSAARCTLGRSDAATLRRPAAVVRLGRHVGDGADLEPGGLQRPDRGLAAGAGALDEDVDLLHA